MALININKITDSAVKAIKDATEWTSQTVKKTSEWISNASNDATEWIFQASTRCFFMNQNGIFVIGKDISQMLL